jgi:hypothetical protein
MRLEKEEKSEIKVKQIEFEIVYHVDFGQKIVVCGSGNEIGAWDPKRR